MTKKKIFIIIGVVLAVVAIGFGVYFAWKKSKEILSPGPFQPSGEFGVAPVAEVSKNLKIISDQPVFDYWVTGGPLVFINDQTSQTVSVVAKNQTSTSTSSTSTSSTSTSIATSTATIATSTLKNLEKQVFYFNQSGQIFWAKEGEDEIVSDRIINDLQKIEADKDGLNVIVQYGSLTTPQIELFSLVTKIFQPLEKVSSATFSPDGTKIAYFESNLGLMTNLIIKDLVGKKKQTVKILSLTQRDFNLMWPEENVILLVPKTSYVYNNEVFSVDIKNKTITSFASGYGLMFNWSRDGGEFGLKFESNIKGVKWTLSLIDITGAIRANMDFVTLPNKCSIGAGKIYCAIPQSYTSFQEPKLPDEYLKRAAYSTDFFYAIDMIQNSFTAIFTEEEPVVDAIHFTPFDGQLLFINRYDDKVYSLML